MTALKAEQWTNAAAGFARHLHGALAIFPLYLHSAIDFRNCVKLVPLHMIGLNWHFCISANEVVDLKQVILV